VKTRSKAKRYIVDVSSDFREDLHEGVLTPEAANLLWLIAQILDEGMLDTSVYMQIGHTKDGSQHVITLKGIDGAPFIGGTDWGELSAGIKVAVESLCDPL